MHEVVTAPRKRRSKSAAKALVVKQPEKSPEQQFHEAYAAMSPKMPVISKDENIVIRGSKIGFASYPAIRRATDAVMSEHGFYMIHQGEWLRDNNIFVVRSYLRHIGGFFVPSEAPIPIKPIPGSAMTEAQGVGNAFTYGRRYNTLALLNIVSEAPQDKDIDGAMTQIKAISPAQLLELADAITKYKVPISLFEDHFGPMARLPARDFVRAMKTVKGYTPPKQEDDDAKQDTQS